MTEFTHALLDSSIRISLVAAAVSLILLAARIGSSTVRHTAWTAVLCAMLLMPILPYFVPSVVVAIQLPALTTVPISDTPDALPISADAWPASVASRSPTTPPPAANIQPPRVSARQFWRPAALLVYGLGLFALLVRLLFGWLAARRLALAGRLVPELSGQLSIYESPVIAVPLTIGVWVPRITLPATWRRWPSEKLRAVLAHESAHVRRRDSLIRLAAQVNRCVFWFHPLAWWLERKLASTAEHACDDAAIQAVGDPRRYAETLLDLAAVMRDRGGRYSWQGIGMDGTGLLGQRIDRILRGNLRSVSRPRKALVALGCAAVIILVAGCRQQSKVTALQDNPQTNSMKVTQEFSSAAKSMTAEQAAALESTLKNNPDDLDAHKKLLIFYRRFGQPEKPGLFPLAEKNLTKEQVITREQVIAARRQHILWLIQHHPADPMAASWEAQVFLSPLDLLADPTGYTEASKLWLTQTESATASPQVLANAASFFHLADQPLAEKLLERAQALDPKGRWTTQLGRLDYEVLVGSNASMPMGIVRSVSWKDAHSSYVMDLRKKLAESKDPQLLAATGDALVISGGPLYLGHHIDFDAPTLGKSYLERAIQLDPESNTAHRDLDLLRRLDRDKPLNDAIRNKQESQYAASLPESDRYRVLAQLALHSYWLAEFAERGSNRGDHAADEAHTDLVAAKAHWEQAGKYAQESLQLAPKFTGDPDYGTTIYNANMTLGMVAMQNGNRKAAVGYLLEAAKAPRTEELAYSMQAFSFKLPAWLLKDGEREPVIAFLERFAQVNVAQRSYLLESAALIRNGKKPLWYQN